MKIIIALLFRLISVIPLPMLHCFGNLIGAVAFHTQPKLRQRIAENIQSAGIISDNAERNTFIKRVCQETAKGGLELAVAWMRPSAEIEQLFHEVHGWEHIQAAVDAKKGLLLITPHLGSYDLAGRYISCHLPFPLTAMFRPPRKPWLYDVMNNGRQRDNGRTAPANLQGVKIVMKALRAAQATIVLPDQVPTGGEGIWAEFLGKPAYTMTLAAKLANMNQVATLFFCGERRSDGKGFALHIEPVHGEFNGDIAADVQLINRNVEYWIRRFPEQYLFSYNRFKQPSGVPPKPETAAETDKQNAA